MNNIFDQFDEPQATGAGNIFDRFDKPPQSKKQKEKRELPFSESLVRGAADVITFGLADRIAAGLGALTGIGGTRGDYAANLAAQREATAAAREANPKTYIAGQLAGGFAVPGRAAMQAATLPGRIGRGAAVGALQGGAYGAGSSEDLTNLPEVARDAATGAAIGGILGGAATPAIEILGRGAGRAISGARGIVNPKGEAARRVAGALAEDARVSGVPLRAESLARMQRAGQPAVIGDIGGETTAALARSAADTSTAARQVLEETVQPRFNEQSARVSEFLGGLGAGNTTQTLELLQAKARAANKPLYERAFKEGESGIWHDGLAKIMDAPVVADAVKGAIKTGANRAVAEGFRPQKAPFEIDAAGMLTPKLNPDGSRARPTLQFWDSVKRNLDDKIGSLLRSGEKSAASDAQNLRSQLVGYLDSASPSYASARGTAAKFFGAEDALEAGSKFVAAKGSNDSFRKSLHKMTAPERELFAHGFASELANSLSRLGDSTDVVRKIGSSPQAKERLEMALGPQRAEKLMGFLSVEAAMNNLKTAVQGNSKTARYFNDLQLAGGALGADYLLSGGFGGNITAGTLGLLALRRGVRAGGQAVNRNVAEHVGKLLASDSPSSIKQLQALAAKSGRVRNQLLSITPRLIAGVIPLAVGAATE